MAHRGASAVAAENTLGAIRCAMEQRADMVEVDVQRTRDGVLVLIHDTTLARTTNAAEVYPSRAPWRVADFTYDELMRLEAGSWKSRAFHGEQIPTLDDAIALTRDSGLGLLVELKKPDLYPGVVADVVATIRGIPGCLDSAVPDGRLVVQSFSYAAMKELKTRLPGVPVGLLGAPARANLPALATWADQVNPSHLCVDKGYVDLVHELGMGCLVWTVNRGPAIRRALRIGVDGIITNRPDYLSRVLRARTASVS